MMRKLVWLAAMAPLGVLAQPAPAPQDCGTAVLEVPVVPEALKLYRIDMEKYGTAEMTEEEKTAREARRTTQSLYDPRKATLTDGTIIDVSNRFCALDYDLGQAGNDACPATWDNGNAKVKGLECAGVPPTADSECAAENIKTNYPSALSMSIVLPIAVGIVFMVLYFVWYLLRICKLCGGCYAGVGWCCMDYFNMKKYIKNDPDDMTGEMPGYVADPSCIGQLGCFRGWFSVFFGLTIVAALIGFIANDTVHTGLTNTVDILFYDVQDMVYGASTLMGQMNDEMVAGGFDMGDAIVEQQGQMACLSKQATDMETSITEAKDLGLDVRAMIVQVTLGIPLLLALLNFIGAWCKWSSVACFSNILTWLLLIVVCISAAAHGAMSMLFADICYEFDLHLATYTLPESDHFDTAQELNWLPPDAKGICGPGGKLSFIEDQFDRAFDEGIQKGIDAIAEQCNTPELQGFLDCSGVTILDGVAGAVDTPATYTGKIVACAAGVEASAANQCGSTYFNGLLAAVPDLLHILDVDMAAAANIDIDNIPPQIKNCLGSIGTCVETAATSVVADAASCDAVTALTDTTACSAVMTAADGAVAACTWSTAPFTATGWDLTAANNEACTESSIAVTGSCMITTGSVALSITAVTCTETAGTTVAADATACAAVTASDLTSAAVCGAVMTTADGAVAACTYTGTAVPQTAATEFECGVCADATQMTSGACATASAWTPYTWTALSFAAYTAADGPVATITANAEECITHGTVRFMARTPGVYTTPTTEEATSFYTLPQSADEVAAINAWATTAPTGDEIKQCFIDTDFFTMRTFRDCAENCAPATCTSTAATDAAGAADFDACAAVTGAALDDDTECDVITTDDSTDAADAKACTYGAATPKETSAAATAALDSATTLFTNVVALYESGARPVLQCKFVSDTIRDIFFPVCNEAYGGLTTIALANYIALVGLIISFPMGVMGTKRYVKKPSTGEGEGEDNAEGQKHFM